MLGLFMGMYVSFAGIGAGAAMLAGHSLCFVVAAGWLFPAVMFGIVMLPPIVIRRVKESALMAHAVTSDG